MKSIKSLVVILILSFGVTGCYTQLHYSQTMHSITDRPTARGYSWSGEEQPEKARKDEQAHSREQARKERQAPAKKRAEDREYVPVYYKDYDVVETYASCNCNPYTDYALYLSPRYSALFTTYRPASIWAPDWFVAFHAGYSYYGDFGFGYGLSYLYNDFRYRSWAFHYYHMGHTLASAWPYYMGRHYDPFFYDPFFHDPYYYSSFYYSPYYYGGGLGYHNVYYTGGYYTTGENRKDDNRRYGPRSDIGASGVIDRDGDRSRSRSAVTPDTNREKRYGLRSGTRGTVSTRSKEDAASRVRNRVRSTSDDSQNRIRARTNTVRRSPETEQRSVTIPADRNRVRSQLHQKRAVEPKVERHREKSGSLFGRFRLIELRDDRRKLHREYLKRDSKRTKSRFTFPSRTKSRIIHNRSSHTRKVQRSRSGSRSSSSSDDDSRKRSRNRDN